jgi:hypothetical protein
VRAWAWTQKRLGNRRKSLRAFNVLAKGLLFAQGVKSTTQRQENIRISLLRLRADLAWALAIEAAQSMLLERTGLNAG